MIPPRGVRDMTFEILETRNRWPLVMTEISFSFAANCFAMRLTGVLPELKSKLRHMYRVIYRRAPQILSRPPAPLATLPW